MMLEIGPAVIEQRVMELARYHSADVAGFRRGDRALWIRRLLPRGSKAAMPRNGSRVERAADSGVGAAWGICGFRCIFITTKTTSRSFDGFLSGFLRQLGLSSIISKLLVEALERSSHYLKMSKMRFCHEDAQASLADEEPERLAEKRDVIRRMAREALEEDERGETLPLADLLECSPGPLSASGVCFLICP